MNNNFISSLNGVLTNMAPYWSSKTIELLNIGNEYNMLITLIFGQIIKICVNNLKDEYVIIILIIIAITVLLHKMNIKIIDLNYFKSKFNSVTISYNNENTIISDNFIKLNNILIEKNITNKISFNNDYINYLVEPKKTDILFDKNIYIEINKIKNDKLTTINIIVKSNKINVKDYIENMLKNYKLSKYYHVKIMMNHKKYINAINEYLLTNCNIQKVSYQQKCNYDELKENYDVKTKEENDMKNKEEVKKEPKEIDILKNEIEINIEDIKNLEIIKDVYLTIEKEYYIFKSLNKSSIDSFIKNVNEKYEDKNDFKYSEIYESFEICNLGKWNFTEIPKIIWAINYYLVNNNKNVSKIMIYENFDDHSIMFNKNINKKYFRINNAYNILIKEDTSLSIIRYNDEKNNLTKNKKIVKIIYKIKSKYPLDQFIGEIYNNYNKILLLEKKHKPLYHFNYIGNNEYSVKTLSINNGEHELYETFEHLHNEHNETIINDLDRLKDLEYYKKKGLKRKKGYLFYGIPGSGKTSTVVAMALYDQRHIIEINFNLLKTQKEMQQIMNLRNINGIDIDNNNIILLFDEIECGLKKYNRQNEILSSSNEDTTLSLVSAISKEILLSDNKDNELDIAKILSSLDGIGNYNGLVIVGTTNYLDKLDPAIYRELRLTPIHFRELRKCDVIGIIEKYFDEKMSEEQKEKIIDRYVSPAKCIHNCQIFEKKGIDELLKHLFNK